MPRFDKVTAHSAITGNATSTEIYCGPHGSVMIEHLTTNAVNQTCEAKIYGSMTKGGAKVPVYDRDTSAQITTGAISTGRTIHRHGIPEYIVISATLTTTSASGTTTINVQPFTL